MPQTGTAASAAPRQDSARFFAEAAGMPDLPCASGAHLARLRIGGFAAEGAFN